MYFCACRYGDVSVSLMFALNSTVFLLDYKMRKKYSIKTILSLKKQSKQNIN